MVPIKGRNRGRPTRHKGVRKLGPERYEIRKTRADPKTGRKQNRVRVHEGSLESAVQARAALWMDAPTVKRSRPRFETYAAEWLVNHVEIRNSTSDRYHNDVANLCKGFGDWWVDAITYRDLVDWRTAQAGRFAAPTVNTWIRTLRQILDEAVTEGLMASNPARKLTTLKESRTGGARGRSLNVDRFRLLLDTAEQLGARDKTHEKRIPADAARAIQAIAWTGARISEVVALRFDDIVDGELRIERRIWRGHEDPTKTDDPRALTPTGPLLAVIDAQRRWLLETQHPGLESGLIFPASLKQARAGWSRRRKSNPEASLLWFKSQSGIQEALKLVCEVAGIPRVSPHALRRTLEDIAREAGVPDLVRRALHGWREKKSQGIYATVSREERDAAAGQVLSFVYGGGE